MKRVLVVGEDRLCCALGERLVEDLLPGWHRTAESVDKAGITKLVPELPRYARFARHGDSAVLCIADTDRRCAKELAEKWCPGDAPPNFLLRLAVTEAESWVLADRTSFARHFDVPLNKVPLVPDELPDPTRVVLELVSKSRKKLFREEMVNFSRVTKAGAGYNLHLGGFVRNGWHLHEAASNSPSLARAVSRMQALGAMQG